MAKYNILIKPSAVKEIEEVPTKKDRQRITERIGSLADNPRQRGCEKLSGQKKYLVRQGRYSIVYSVDDQDFTVDIVKVGHRKN